jgi:hypothetical protein
MASSRSDINESSSQLTIRCALQSFADTIVDCPHSWTVLQLKQHLHDICPGHPDISRQRLIYAGQCLRDDRTMASILRTDPTCSQVVHIVCPPTDVSMLDRQADQLRQRRIATTIAPTTYAYTSQQPILNNSPSSWQQLYQQQQIYQAYMLNYANYMQQIVGTMNGSPMAAASMFSSTPQSAVPVAQVEQPAPVPQPVAPMGPAPQPAMDVQNGIGQNDEEREQDWLDWIYAAVRSTLLMSVIYFYSTPERLFGVLVTLIVVYFLRGGFRRAVRPNNNVPIPPPPLPGAADAQLPDNSQHQNPIDNSTVIEPSAWMVFWTTCYTFITSFFASLIPETPPPANIN